MKTDYEQLISKDRGLLNHTRLLKAMVIILLTLMLMLMQAFRPPQLKLYLLWIFAFILLIRSVSCSMLSVIPNHSLSSDIFLSFASHRLFLASLLLTGDWSSAVWCFRSLHQLLACASLQNSHRIADWLQLHSVTVQCHIEAAFPPRTHRGGVICNRGRWGNALLHHISQSCYFFREMTFFSFENDSSCNEHSVQEKSESAAPHFSSPTTSIWVTVICGMFPVIAENNTTAKEHTHVCAHAHTYIKIFITNQSHIHTKVQTQ